MIHRITIDEALQFRQAGQREGLAGFSPNAEYYGITVGDRIVAITSIQYFAHHAKFNNHYVVPEHRRQGLLKLMMNFSIAEVLKRGISIVTATCTEKSLPEYLKRGAVVTKRYKYFTAVQLKLN